MGRRMQNLDRLPAGECEPEIGMSIVGEGELPRLVTGRGGKKDIRLAFLCGDLANDGAVAIFRGVSRAWPGQCYAPRHRRLSKKEGPNGQKSVCYACLSCRAVLPHPDLRRRCPLALRPPRLLVDAGLYRLRPPLRRPLGCTPSSALLLAGRPSWRMAVRLLADEIELAGPYGPLAFPGGAHSRSGDCAASMHRLEDQA